MRGLFDRLTGRTSQITDEVVRRCVAEIPFYRHLPAELVDREVRRSVEATVLLFAQTFRKGRSPAPEEVTEIIAWSGRRAEEHVPLEAALTAHVLGMEVIWEALSQAVRPDETAELAVAGAALLQYQRCVIPAVAVAHLDEQQRSQAEAREIHRALVAALLAGQPAHGLGEAAGVPVAPAYVVLELRFTDPPLPWSASRAVSGGTVRRLQAALDAMTGARVVAALDQAGGVALLPTAMKALDTALDELPALLAGLAEAVGRPLLAAAAAAESAALPVAAAEAAEVLELVGRLGRPPGLYRFEDVVLEYQLARPGPGRAALAGRLDPLDERPELLETLCRYVEYGHNRSRTAVDLHIHRNTLDYRLRKVAALTGLDPAVPAQARLLDAAVIARDLGPPPEAD